MVSIEFILRILALKRLISPVEQLKSPDIIREIVCSILKEDSTCISIRNTSDPVMIIHGEIPTTKQDAAEHGYGFQAVKYILNQLDAEYTFAYHNGWFRFVVEIPD